MVADSTLHAYGTLIEQRSLEWATEHIFSRNARLVGWGTGSVFEYFHRLFPVRLDYVVDNDSQRWGQRIHGLEVSGPERLASETDPVFIIVYSSAWPEIQRQILELGLEHALPASVVFATDARTRTQLEWADHVASEPRRPRCPIPEHAIVIQGPVVPDVTTRVLQVTAALHPNDVVIVSTWHDTPESLLDQVRPLADDVVLSTPPNHGGFQNRNYQIVSTRAGVARAQDHGVHTVLKMRSDLAVLLPNVFDRARWWLSRFDTAAVTAAGLSRRLIVPASFTRKYLTYHPSDLVMLGHVEDMARYWSAPLDWRESDSVSSNWSARSAVSCCAEGAPAESYLGTQFCQSIGRPIAGTLADSWAFYRDLFTVVDNEWFDLLWFKNPSIPDLTVRRGTRQLVGQQFWERLYYRDPSLTIDLTEFNPAMTMTDALAHAS